MLLSGCFTGGDAQTLEWEYANPITFYYALQFNAKADDNVMFAFDGAIRPIDGRAPSMVNGSLTIFSMYRLQTIRMRLHGFWEGRGTHDG